MNPVRSLLLIPLLCVGIQAFGQKAQVDSLERLLRTRYAPQGSKADSVRIPLLVQASELLLRIDPSRSLELSKEALRLSITTGQNAYVSHIYNNTGTANRIQGNYEKAISFHTNALENDRKRGNRAGEALSLNNLGNVYLKQGKYKDAIASYERSLNIRQDLNDNEGVAASLNNLGMVYKNQGDHDRALSYYQNALKIFEQMGDRVGRANALNNIGIVHRSNGNPERALEVFLDALAQFEKLGNKVGEANTLNNIGNIYYQQGRHDQALEFYEKSYKISEAVGDVNAMAGKLGNMAGVYLVRGDKDKAVNTALRALELQERIGDEQGQISTLNNIGAYYLEEKQFDLALGNFLKAEKLEKRTGDRSYTATTLTSIGQVYQQMGQHTKALDYLTRALREAKGSGNSNAMLSAYSALGETHAALGDYKKSYDSEQARKQLQDSLERESSTKDLARMQAQFENERKQREIEMLNKENEVNQLRLAKQRMVRNLIIVLTVLILITLILIYSRYKAKQRANVELEGKNREIAKQKEIVEEKNWAITSSIEYAKRIQDAIMPTMAQIREFLPESFVYYRPKEIVSGDFYWFSHQHGQTYLAAVDCTGHGVPGAFMSMIGNDHLNQIVNVEMVKRPDQVLNRLHEEIQVTLKQKHGVSENHDGMDVALCAIDRGQRKLYFSSANRYLYFIRDNELSEVKGDHFNIGGVMHEDVRQYNVHELDLLPGDTFYMFSDGLSDQFGGGNSKKFGYRRLKDLLLQMHAMPMDTQREFFEKSMLQWMGGNDQIDDFLLIGVRV